MAEGWAPGHRNVPPCATNIPEKRAYSLLPATSVCAELESIISKACSVLDITMLLLVLLSHEDYEPGAM